MKKIIITLLLLTTLVLGVFSQLKKDGTPDMRYKSNKQVYSNSYSTPTYNSTSTSYSPPATYKNTTTSYSAPTSTTNTSVRYQNGYYKPSTNTNITSHYKTNTNKTNHDNFSTNGNINPYTGSSGTKAKDYSNDAYNYGNGKTIHTGTKGGQYYYNSNGNKTYVPKR